MLMLCIASVSAITVVTNSTVQVVNNEIDDYTSYKFSSQGFKFYYAVSQIWYSDYPFVERDTATTLSFRVLRDSDFNFIVDDAPISTITFNGNQTFNLTYDTALKGYAITVIFNKTEDVPFVAHFWHSSGVTIKDFKGTLKVRKYGTLQVQLYSDDNQTIFSKHNSLIIAYPEVSQKVTDTAYFNNIISTIGAVNNFLYSFLGIPQGNSPLRFYTIYSTPVFYGFMQGGRATIRVPMNETMSVRVMGGSASDSFILSNNAFATLYYKGLKFDVPITTTVLTKNSKYIEAIITNWDTEWGATLGGWILRVVSLLVLFGLPIVLYAYTGNSQMAWNVFGILFVVLGALNLGFLIFKPILGF
jgi:hypothetical protein